MFSFTLVVIALLGLALIFLGVGVFLRNTQSRLNQLFFSFVIWVSLWLIINYIAADPNVNHTISLWSNRLVLIAGGATLLSLLAFVLQLTTWISKAKWFIYLVVLTFISWIICLTPFVVQNVFVKNDQVVNVFGPLAAVYFIPLFVATIATAVILIRAHYRLTGLLRTQVDTISRSILISIPIIIIGNAVLPIWGNYSLVSYTPLSLSLIIFAMAYVIARHRLFNIRPLIVRSIAYAVSLGFISIIYALGAHYITTLVSAIDNSIFTVIANVALVVFIVTAYQPVKRLFDKATNRFFYKDAYDPQQLLNDLNRVHVTNLDLSKLAHSSMDILSSYLKTQYCALTITQHDNSRTFSSGQNQPSNQDLVALYSKTNKIRKNSFVADDLVDTNPDLSSMLEKTNVSVLLKLRQGSASLTDVGYLVIGPRKSGSAYSNEDLRTLETVVNELSIAIQNALRFEEIQNFAATLQGRVDEATKKLRKANEKLKEMDETKDDFISMASHQLRTPLTSMKGYVSMVLEGDAGKISAQQKEMLSQAYFSSQRMVYLIADLLNVSRLKTGKFIIEPASINLATIIDQELNQLQETAASRNLKLNYVRPKDFPNVMLDETKTRQVIMNFVDNAIYYTPSGGHVTVRLTETPTTIELRVEDDGIGVAKSDQPHLFTKFYRAGNARKARPDGTGLGLFMAKKVIMAEGGTLIFESTEGKGSTFGFIFSKAKVGLDASGGTIVEHTPVVEPK